MGVFGKRKSGKTTLVYTIINKFLNKNTILLFFVPTFKKDPTYQAIAKELDERNVPYEAFDELSGDGDNIIEEFMKVNGGFHDPQEEKKERDPTSARVEIEDPCRFFCSDGKKSSATKKKKEKKPEYIIIFDDMSNMLRTPAVKLLAKNSRHYRAKIIFSSQAPVDVAPDIFAQMEYVALYKHFNNHVIEFIYNRLQLHMPLEPFTELYKAVTDGKTKEGFNNFILLNIPDEKYFVNLDKEIDISCLTLD